MNQHNGRSTQRFAGMVTPFAMLSLAAAMLAGCGATDDDKQTEPGNCTSFEELPAQIATPMTISKGSCYRATSDAVVDSGGHLTIEPGVVLQFGQDKGLVVQGTGKLTAIGTQTERIVFTGAESSPGYWKGVAFHGTNSSDNVLAFVTIEYGGGAAHYRSGASNLAIDGRTGQVRVAIRDSILRHSGAAGLWADGDNENANISITEFENNQLTLNKGPAASVRPNVVGSLKATSSFAGNDKDYVYVHNNKELLTVQTWEALDVPYRISSDFAVKQAGHLTLGAGAQLIFEENAGISVWSDARMTAIGTATAPIVLTGAEKIRGFWKGIAYHGTNSTENVLEYVTIEYGGGLPHYRVGAANLAVDDRVGQVRLQVRNSTLRESAGYGFWADGDNNNLNIHITGFENNVLTRNAAGPAAVRPTVSGIFSPTGTYSGNDQDYIFIRTDKVMAQSQTWAALDVPYRVQGELKVEQALLTIEAGAQIIFEADRGLSVWGTGRLQALGTAARPIRFTGLESTRGYWKGIAYHGTNSIENVLEHVLIDYGGGLAHYRVQPAGLAIDNRTGAVRVKLIGVSISNSALYGLFIESSWANSVTIENCDVTFAENASNNIEPATAQCPR